MTSNTIEAVRDALKYFRHQWALTGCHPASQFSGCVTDLTAALATKAEYNRGRTYRHGKEF